MRNASIGNREAIKRDNDMLRASTAKKIVYDGITAILLIVFFAGWIFSTNYNKQLKTENAEFQQQIQTMQQGFKEGPYTMITNLSSSMYINGVSEDIEGVIHWTDVNGVSGFDVTINGTHYRYVEGHIEMPQLSLYAPYLYTEVANETEN
jgi:hypothetical protein